jgi:hypothetical protein
MFPNLHRFLTFVYILVLSTEDIESGFVTFSCHEKFPPRQKQSKPSIRKKPRKHRRRSSTLASHLSTLHHAEEEARDSHRSPTARGPVLRFARRELRRGCFALTKFGGLCAVLFLSAYSSLFRCIPPPASCALCDVGFNWVACLVCEGRRQRFLV